MWKNFLKKHQGFTMIELLLALMATSICTLLLVQAVSVMIHSYKRDYRVEDDVAIKQLQLLFVQGSGYETQTTSCTLSYHDEQIIFEQYEDKLVKRSGFEIFLQDIDEVFFSQEGGCVYVSWRRKETTLHAPLGCE